MTFEEVMELTRTVSSNTAFEDEECLAYFDVLMGLPENALIVEVGLEYGRSSSIALQVGKERSLHYHGIDPFDDREMFQEWARMATTSGHHSWFVSHAKSSDVRFTYAIDAILIDGDHSYEGVKADCEHFLPHVVSGGYAMFHDYARESLPGVFLAVNEYMLAHDQEWNHEQHVGTLGIWRRI